MTTTAQSDKNWQRGFWWLFVTQFQGAFSDNILKWLVISLITSMGFSNDKRDQLVGRIQRSYGIAREEAEKQVREWTNEGRYVTGPQIAAVGLAEMVELA